MAVLKALRALLALSLACVAAGPVAAAPSEYQVKAVFLFNFSRFVEWPAAAFPSAEAPFSICVFGHDPFGTDLDDVVKGETAAGRPIVVRRVEKVAAVAGCQILFLDHVESRQIDEVVAATEGHHTLTVSDVAGQAQRGFTIRLVTEQGRVRLRVDVGSARAAGLVINSNLLRSADIVSERDGARR